MRALNIIGLVLVFVFIGVCGYYIEEVNHARWSSYIFADSFSTGSSAKDLTIEAGLISLSFFLFYSFIYVGNMVKVKTKSSKIFAIIGLSITLIFLLWDGLMMSSPGHMSFDEVGVGFIFYGLITLAFLIIHLIQSIRYHIRSKNLVPEMESIIDNGEL